MKYQLIKVFWFCVEINFQHQKNPGSKPHQGDTSTNPSKKMSARFIALHVQLQKGALQGNPFHSTNILCLSFLGHGLDATSENNCYITITAYTVTLSYGAVVMTGTVHGKKANIWNHEQRKLFIKLFDDG